MAIIDHVFLLLLAAGQPIHGAYSYRKFLARLRAGTRESRARLYRGIHVFEWSALAVLMTTWVLLERPFAALGFRGGFGTGFLVAAAIVVAMCVYLLVARRAVRRMSQAERQEQIDALGDLVHFLPQSKHDYRRFVGVSLTAGVVEEVVYRGFLFWYLLPVLPMWAVIVVSALLFALGHSYQGVGGMLRVFAIGVAAGVLYALAGSIWLLIVAHALLDILQGAAILELFRDAPGRRIRGTGDLANAGDSRLIGSGDS